MPDIEFIGFNIKLFKLINGLNHPFFDTVFYLITYLGSGLILIPIVLVLYAIRKEKILPVVTSYLLLSIAVQVIKYFWNFPRPAALFDNIHIVGETLKAASFPSGHTATAFMLFYVLTKGKSIPLKTFLMIPALAVGYSRIYIGAHFPIDVLAGGIIGYLSGYFSVKYIGFFEKYRNELLVLLLIPAVLFLYNLDTFPFYIVDEARNAEAAREMLERSDFIVPTYNYELRTDKPPLHYWIFILAYKLIGVNELSSRIGSAIIGVATVLLVYFFAARILNKKIALVSALILPTCLYSFLIFRMAVPDPYLVFFNTLALFSFYLSTSNPVYTYVFYICLGLGTLTKGPVGFILPFGIAFAFTFFREILVHPHNDNKGTRHLLFSGLKALKVFLTSRHVVGYLIVAVIAIPWYIIISIKTGGKFASGFFLYHNIGRFLYYSIKGPEGPFIITFLFFLMGFFPWSFFTIQVLVSSYKEKRDSLVLFLLLWVILYLVFYSISATKLPQYLIPIYPALSILTAKYLSRDMSYRKASAAFIGIFGLSACIALSILGNKYAKELMPYITFLGLPFLIGGVIVLLRDRYIPQTIAVSTLVFLFLVSGWFMPKTEKYFIPKKIGRIIEEQTKKSGGELIHAVYSYKYYDPAFEFYIRKKIIRIDEPSLLPEGSLLIGTEDKLIGLNNVTYRQLFKIRDSLRNKEVLVVQVEGK
jgi:4-amino-4-deoxy-L-arabinose transferase-like glycosyltransferase